MPASDQISRFAPPPQSRSASIRAALKFPLVRFVIKTPPETAASGSSLAPAATLPPASQTAPPDAHTLPNTFLARAAALRENSARPTSPPAAPTGSQKTRSTLLFHPASGSRCPFPPPHLLHPCSDTAAFESPPATS